MKYEYIFILFFVLASSLFIGYNELSPSTLTTFSIDKTKCMAGEPINLIFTFTGEEGFALYKYYYELDDETKLLYDSAIYDSDKVVRIDNYRVDSGEFVINAPSKVGTYELKLIEKKFNMDKYDANIDDINDMDGWEVHNVRTITLTVISEPDITINSNIPDVTLKRDGIFETTIDSTKTYTINNNEFDVFEFKATKDGYKDYTFIIDTRDGDVTYNLNMELKESSEPSLTIISDISNVDVECNNGNNYKIGASKILIINDLNEGTYEFTTNKDGYMDYKFSSNVVNGGQIIYITLKESPTLYIYTPSLSSDIYLNNGEKIYKIPIGENLLIIDDLTLNKEYRFEVNSDGYSIPNFYVKLNDKDKSINIIPTIMNEPLDTDLINESNENLALTEGEMNILSITIVDENNTEINDAIIYVNDKSKDSLNQPIEFIVPDGKVKIFITHPEMIDYTNEYEIIKNTNLTISLVEGEDNNKTMYLNNFNDMPTNYIYIIIISILAIILIRIRYTKK